MKLLIANKNYSSWSLRAWLTLRGFEIPFEEELLLLNGEGWKEAMLERSPTGQVPVLIDGDLVIPETLAIIEYVADKYPQKHIWPADRNLRARARAASAEMHAGFTRLRNAAPMNLRASHPGKVSLDYVADDLDRLQKVWGDLLDRSGGPYLGGAFSAVDAMFAPVATRIRVYDLPVPDFAAEYVEAIYALPAFQEWYADALKESWIVEQDEIDFIQGRKQ
ncbi:glutathione S-transferase [Paradevosia shaoguanensis]|uniref:Glutathione S-transferase n=1 Tax=Paradevosia shaoguanensis TaxID=1335043 RepID=A0AA41QNH0_9HYPH|nr:glutathione S-transferase [Paradevosia shaoguanensis]MCF1742915.1 glutathione S-transferase [Paradevosia shaoguanensis]MCI0127398.1 glutathione S-transferase [Paradevosia shaoguanensis]